jgi:tetratricopeptide (TPR) repeat protein
MQRLKNLSLLCLTTAVLLIVCGATSDATAGKQSGQAIDKGSALMQEGGLLIEASRHQDAADVFARAGKQLGGSYFSDDAEFSRIIALEAAGHDETATKLWKQWAKEFDTSPLATEAEIARTWNLVRRGQLTAAREVHRELIEAYPWLRHDGRARTLGAAIDFAEGRFAQALTWLAEAAATESSSRPELPALGLLLEGLCHEQVGAEYSAVVAYQRLLDGYAGSRLRGYAHLAKGRIFALDEDFREAAHDFEALAESAIREDLRAESRFLAAACRFLAGETGAGINDMARVAKTYAGQDMAARALFALGEMRWQMADYELAITRFNQVLAAYFANDLAGSALYRTGRCLDALGRTREANSAYQAVADGYPYAQEAPSAVYLAGVGLLEQGLPRDAAPYFQLVLDRYAGRGAAFVFESPEHQELVEASLCLLEYSYHQSDQLGRMAGSPHLALQKMPPSRSLWRAYALLLDADALSAQARFPEAQVSLDRLLTEFPDHPVGIRANRLLAWTYARQGRQDLAIETEQRMLARYTAQSDETNLSAARLTMAHSRFNAKDYPAAVAEYAEFLRMYPTHEGASAAGPMLPDDGAGWRRGRRLDPDHRAESGVGRGGEGLAASRRRVFSGRPLPRSPPLFHRPEGKFPFGRSPGHGPVAAGPM